MELLVGNIVNAATANICFGGKIEVTGELKIFINIINNSDEYIKYLKWRGQGKMFAGMASTMDELTFDKM